MIYHKTEYNPFPAIKELAIATTRENYNQAFHDYVRKQLFMGGVAPETEDEFSEILTLLFDMDII